MKTKFALLVVLAVALSACQNNKKAEKNTSAQKTKQIVDTVHTSQNSLDWAGTYTGVLPCADCPGIKTTLTLNNDNTYSLKMDYLERKSSFKEEGEFKWNTTGSKITLYPKEKNSASTSYQVGENKLFQLDGDGNRITGELADKFILTKE